MVQKFDPRISPSFSSLLKFPLQVAVEEYVGSVVYPVALGGQAVRLMRRVFAATNRLEQNGGVPTIDEIAVASKVTASQAWHFSRREHIPRPGVSLQAPVSGRYDDGDQMLADLLPSDDPTAIERVFSVEVRQLLSKALLVLNNREKHIILVRVAPPDGSDGDTLAQLALEFGVSRERIRQIEAKAFEKLRDYMLKNSLTYDALSVL
jgi:DNA-directed RNA polymerase sigma subunit (sigma70/sigma32)